jgi:peptidoglycan/LPS O-acetylase OafA/YrhL
LRTERPFLNYIHQFRGFAILLIVGVHTLISLPWKGSVYTKNLIFSITNNGTILFVFIAGFLFYYLSHNKFSYQDYLKKKIKYVILPYLIISIPALADKLFVDNGDHWWMKGGFMDRSIPEKLLYMLATGKHSGVLWFIPMIAVFYLFSILFIKWSKTKSFNYLVPLLLVLGLWTNQFGYYSNIALSFLHFLPVYLFGMWFAKLREPIFQKGRLLLFASLLIYAVFSLLEVLDVISISKLIDLRDHAILILKFNPGKLKAIVFCVFLMIFFQKYEKKESRILKLTGDYSFGIFFLHLYCINFFQLLFNKHLIPINGLNIFTYLVYFIIVTALCLLAVHIIKLIFKSKSRLIIGS